MDGTNNKYLKEDNLFEDPVIYNQRYVLCSFLGPELVKNCKIRAVKARGFFQTRDDAIRKKEELEKIDEIHKIFITDVGKWCASDAQSAVILNELAGRKKEYLENCKKTHKNRVKESIKSGVLNSTSNVEDYDDSQSQIFDKTEYTKTEKSMEQNNKNTEYSGPQKNDFFEHQDLTEVKNKEEIKNNGRVDINELKNDPKIDGQEYCLYSFLAPEGLMNTQVRSVKFRGAFPNKEEASKKAELLRKLDKDYDIFIGNVGHWMEQDPDPLSVEHGVYKNKKENSLMENIHKKSYDNKISSINEDENQKNEPNLDKQDKKKLMKKMNRVGNKKLIQLQKMRELHKKRNLSKNENSAKENDEQSQTNIPVHVPENKDSNVLNERIRINEQYEKTEKLSENIKRLNDNIEKLKTMKNKK